VVVMRALSNLTPEAQDALQAGTLAAWQGLCDRFQGRSSEEAWIRGCLAKTTWKQRSRERRRAQLLASGIRRESEVAVWHRAQAQQVELAALAQARDRLSSAHSALLTAAFGLDEGVKRSVRALALQQDRPKSTLHRALQAALQRLRTELTDAIA
jgi:DNA-directed RNA polymerase specialized sigma24 family protein